MSWTRIPGICVKFYDTLHKEPFVWQLFIQINFDSKLIVVFENCELKTKSVLLLLPHKVGQII